MGLESHKFEVPQRIKGGRLGAQGVARSEDGQGAAAPRKRGTLPGGAEAWKPWAGFSLEPRAFLGSAALDIPPRAEAARHIHGDTGAAPGLAESCWRREGGRGGKTRRTDTPAPSPSHPVGNVLNSPGGGARQRSRTVLSVLPCSLLRPWHLLTQRVSLAGQGRASTQGGCSENKGHIQAPGEMLDACLWEPVRPRPAQQFPWSGALLGAAVRLPASSCISSLFSLPLLYLASHGLDYVCLNFWSRVGVCSEPASLTSHSPFGRNGSSSLPSPRRWLYHLPRDSRFPAGRWICVPTVCVWAVQ